MKFLPTNFVNTSNIVNDSSMFHFFSLLLHLNIILFNITQSSSENNRLLSGMTLITDWTNVSGSLPCKGEKIRDLLSLQPCISIPSCSVCNSSKGGNVNSCMMIEWTNSWVTAGKRDWIYGSNK